MTRTNNSFTVYLFLVEGFKEFGLFRDNSNSRKIRTSTICHLHGIMRLNIIIRPPIQKLPLSACLPAILYVFMSFCLPVSMFVCLSVCLSVCLFVCLSVCLSVYFSGWLFLCNFGVLSNRSLVYSSFFA